MHLRISFKKIIHLKSDTASCRWKNFSLKQATGLMGGGGGGGGGSRPSTGSATVTRIQYASFNRQRPKTTPHTTQRPHFTKSYYKREGRQMLNPVLLFCPFQALGCVLFYLCFMEHPFEDSAKLRILNAKYTIPESDSKYTVFHDLISKYTWINSSTFSVKKSWTCLHQPPWAIWTEKRGHCR